MEDNTSEIERLRNRAAALREDSLSAAAIDDGPDAIELEQASIDRTEATRIAAEESSSVERFGKAFVNQAGEAVKNIGKDIALRADAAGQGAGEALENGEGFLGLTAALTTEMTKTSERFNDPEWDPRNNPAQKERVFSEITRLGLDPESSEAKTLMSAGSEHVLNFDIAFIEDKQAKMKELATAGPAGKLGMITGAFIDGDALIAGGIMTKAKAVKTAGNMAKLSKMDNIKDGAKIGAASALLVEGANTYVDPSVDVKDLVAATVLSTGMGAGIGAALPAQRAEQVVAAAADVNTIKATRNFTRGNDFEEVSAFLKQAEGGMVDNPADSGGPTAFGISSANFPQQYKKTKELFETKGRKAAQRYAKNFFKGQFYDKVVTPDMTKAQKLVMTDMAVTSGPKLAKKLFKEAEGDPMRFLELRDEFVRDLAERRPKDKQFLQGWLNRNENLRNKISGEEPAARVRYVLDEQRSVGAAALRDTLEPDIEIAQSSREIHDFIDNEFLQNDDYVRGIRDFTDFSEVGDNPAQRIIKRMGEQLYNGLDKIGLSPDFDKMIRSDNDVLQYMAIKLMNSPVGQIANTKNADNLADLMEKKVAAQYAPSYQRHYGEWYNRKYGKSESPPTGKVDQVRGWTTRNFHTTAEQEFGREVQEFMAHRLMGREFDAPQEIINAADDIERAYGAMLNHHKKHRVEGFEDVEMKAGHFGVRWSGRKWQAMERLPGVGTNRIVQGIKDAILRATPDMDEEMAFIFANAIKRNAQDADTPSPVSSLMTVNEDGRKAIEDVLRENGVPENQLSDRVDSILYNNPEKGSVKASRRRIQMDYTTPIPGTDKTVLDLIDNDVYGVLDSAARGQSAEAARVAATGGLLQKRDLPAWRRAAIDKARENGDDLEKTAKLFDQMTSMYTEGAFNGGVGPVVGRLNKLSRLVYLPQLAITQTAETGIAMGTDTFAAFKKYYGKSFKDAITKTEDKELVNSLSAAGTYYRPDELYVRQSDLDDVPIQDAKALQQIMDISLDKGQRAMGLMSGFYQILGAQQRGLAELSNNYFINGILNGTVENKRLISMGLDEDTQNIIRKYSDLIERDADGHIVNNNMNQWDPEDADAWRMAISRNVDHGVQVTRRGETHAWANTPLGGLLTGLKTFAMNAMYSKTIKSARLADRVAAAQIMYTFGTAAAAVTAKAAINGKLESLDSEELARRSLNWSAHASPLLMLTDPMAHMLGLDYIGDGQLGPLARYRYAQDGLMSLPAGLSAVNDMSGILRAPLDLADDGELDWETVNSLKAVPIAGRMYGVSPLIEQLAK